MRDDIQEPLRIVGKHIDHCEPVAYPVIDLDLSRLAAGGQSASPGHPGTSAQQLIERFLTLQHPDDRMHHG